MLTTNLVADGGFPIGINRMLPQRDTGLHRHDNVELVVVSAGSGRHRVQGGGWPVCRGDVFVIPPGMIHGYDRCQDLQLFNIGYDPIRLALPSARLSALPGFLALVSLEPRLRKEGAFTGHLHLDEASLAAALDAAEIANEPLRA